MRAKRGCKEKLALIKLDIRHAQAVVDSLVIRGASEVEIDNARMIKDFLKKEAQKYCVGA